MEYNEMKTKDLIEIYKEIDSFINYLNKEKENVDLEEKWNKRKY